MLEQKELIEFFWSQVHLDDPGKCWEWQGCKNELGYGWFAVDRKRWKSHRFSYELTYGPIPKGLFICHKCDNPSCCNPRHLFAGTQTDNMQDMLQKGRGRQQHGEKSGRHKLTDAVVRDILADHASGIGYRKLGKKYGVDRKTISCVVRNKTWKHVTR